MTITKTIEIARDPAAVFAALTEPGEIVRHFPLRRVESDGREGGRFILHGEVAGNAFVDHGVIEAFEPGRRFAYRYWSTNHGTERSAENELTLAYDLTPAGGATRLEVTHGNLPSAEYAAMMDKVWDALLAGLRERLEREAPAT